MGEGGTEVVVYFYEVLAVRRIGWLIDKYRCSFRFLRLDVVLCFL